MYGNQQHVSTVSDAGFLCTSRISTIHWFRYRSDPAIYTRMCLIHWRTVVNGGLSQRQSSQTGLASTSSPSTSTGTSVTTSGRYSFGFSSHWYRKHLHHRNTTINHNETDAKKCKLLMKQPVNKISRYS